MCSYLLDSDLQMSSSPANVHIFVELWSLARENETKRESRRLKPNNKKQNWSPFWKPQPESLLMGNVWRSCLFSGWEKSWCDVSWKLSDSLDLFVCPQDHSGFMISKEDQRRSNVQTCRTPPPLMKHERGDPAAERRWSDRRGGRFYVFRWSPSLFCLVYSNRF